MSKPLRPTSAREDGCAAARLPHSNLRAMGNPVWQRYSRRNVIFWRSRSWWMDEMATNSDGITYVHSLKHARDSHRASVVSVAIARGPDHVQTEPGPVIVIEADARAMLQL